LKALGKMILKFQYLPCSGQQLFRNHQNDNFNMAQVFLLKLFFLLLVYPFILYLCNVVPVIPLPVFMLVMKPGFLLL